MHPVDKKKKKKKRKEKRKVGENRVRSTVKSVFEVRQYNLDRCNLLTRPRSFPKRCWCPVQRVRRLQTSNEYRENVPPLPGRLVIAHSGHAGDF
jgi:hypothetical protein